MQYGFLRFLPPAAADVAGADVAADVAPLGESCRRQNRELSLNALVCQGLPIEAVGLPEQCLACVSSSQSMSWQRRT